MEDNRGSFDECGVLLESGRLIARSENTALVLRALTAYSGGLVAELQIHWRGTVPMSEVQGVLYDEAPDGLRLSFGYGDSPEPDFKIPARGSWENSEPRWLAGSSGGGGGENGARCDAAFTLTPYPAANKVTVAWSWPKHQMAGQLPIGLPSISEVTKNSLKLWE
jgi:hypothetical protein